MRKRAWKDRLVGSIDVVELTTLDKVVAVRIKNLGTSTIKTGWNGETCPNEILPGDSDLFDVGTDGLTESTLKIDFDTTLGTDNKAVLMLLIDQGEICD